MTHFLPQLDLLILIKGLRENVLPINAAICVSASVSLRETVW